MMRILTMILALMIAVVFVGSAIATGPGKTVDFAGGAQGKVTFSGDTHKVNKCADCHPKVFAMKKGTAKIAAPHKAGEFCGTCHDGKKAFAQSECAKCHKKAAAGY